MIIINKQFANVNKIIIIIIFEEIIKLLNLINNLKKNLIGFKK